MFKVLVLQEYYGLSDDQIEYHLLDRLSFQRFIGQGLQDRVPDAKTIWLFRQSLMQAGVLDELFVQLHMRLQRIGLVARKGKMVDASFVKVPVQRNSEKENKQIKNGEAPDEWSDHKRSQKDTDADWTKKNKESHYGYKQHIKADVQNKIITNFEVTPASEHDSQVIDELLEPKKEKGEPLYADSAYYSKERIERLRKLGYKPRILEKAFRNTPLSESQKARNKKLSSRRCRVEHIFGWMQQHMGKLVRGIGIQRITARVTLRIICYNLFRATYLMRSRKMATMI
jgi:IS5 family transposase